MKTKLFTILAVTLMLAACNVKKDDAATTTNDAVPVEDSVDGATGATDASEQLYACPMHPEVTGKLNDICPKCEMKLTEPVAAGTENHDEHQH
ncbi:MAG TPA: heavy metal-binding domain-containing protein [Flavobacterium sp.]|jgi:hypothetical protein